ncbi:hypothetical protein PTSG_04971 [Salpingoeca rosetta]|uniref:holo-[acyl-carrier-protein] synthase n=1 Tax=Salpingoeca rosetta (strain ATCC 50818 / BSB-021) TaxID=946362 RepID=F2U955_SALR5|nr:uncharacterized protein PTSG_04971 [Salpingoeca rosetta]EGD73258.1 hypothetical protein PTSG_04971 [Salpingoeca rosetta]|eukprot:XP_004994289.1 hypothetical protein PTSG_04971 [Salpingoeca rosetta]
MTKHNNMSRSWRRVAVNAQAWTPTAKEFAGAIARVQRDERERILRFRFIQDAKSSLVGRLLLRYLVQEELGVPNAEIELVREESGRPVLRCPEHVSQLRFNVSHAGSYVVMAADSEREIGVDVMDHRRPLHDDVERFFELMTTTFTPKEWDNIRRSDTHGTALLEFYRYWTLKESYIKAIGLGLRMDLQRLQFASDPRLSHAQDDLMAVVDGATCEVDGERLSDWTFEQCHLDPRHCVSVCVHRSPGSYRPQPFVIMDTAAVIDALAPLREDELDDPAVMGIFAQMKDKPQRQ